MSSVTPQRFALMVSAPVLLVAFAALLFCSRGFSDPVAGTLIGPVGTASMGFFATGCAANAARVARGRQRLAWTVLATGLAGWTFGDMVWWYASLGGATPISHESVADLG